MQFPVFSILAEPLVAKITFFVPDGGVIQISRKPPGGMLVVPEITTLLPSVTSSIGLMIIQYGQYDSPEGGVGHVEGIVVIGTDVTARVFVAVIIGVAV
jgi:hypothetical protein